MAKTWEESLNLQGKLKKAALQDLRNQVMHMWHRVIHESLNHEYTVSQSVFAIV